LVRRRNRYPSVRIAGAIEQPAEQGRRRSHRKDDIGGVVTGAKGPEAGVWVIAETAVNSPRATAAIRNFNQPGRDA
jgi:hypothetical protein